MTDKNSAEVKRYTIEYIYDFSGEWNHGQEFVESEVVKALETRLAEEQRRRELVVKALDHEITINTPVKVNEGFISGAVKKSRRDISFTIKKWLTESTIEELEEME